MIEELSSVELTYVDGGASVGAMNSQTVGTIGAGVVAAGIATGNPLVAGVGVGIIIWAAL